MAGWLIRNSRYRLKTKRLLGEHPILGQKNLCAVRRPGATPTTGVPLVWTRSPEVAKHTRWAVLKTKSKSRNLRRRRLRQPRHLQKLNSWAAWPGSMFTGG